MSGINQLFLFIVPFLFVGSAKFATEGGILISSNFKTLLFNVIENILFQTTKKVLDSHRQNVNPCKVKLLFLLNRFHSSRICVNYFLLLIQLLLKRTAPYRINVHKLLCHAHNGAHMGKLYFERIRSERTWYARTNVPEVHERTRANCRNNSGFLIDNSAKTQPQWRRQYRSDRVSPIGEDRWSKKRNTQTRRKWKLYLNGKSNND